jgi:hypothetical protein
MFPAGNVGLHMEAWRMRLIYLNLCILSGGGTFMKLRNYSVSPEN